MGEGEGGGGGGSNPPTPSSEKTIITGFHILTDGKDTAISCMCCAFHMINCADSRARRNDSGIVLVYLCKFKESCTAK